MPGNVPDRVPGRMPGHVPSEDARTDLPGGAPADAEVEDALSLLFAGRVEALLPPEEIGEFHDFIREEALRRRRFAVSLRVDCGCLAWVGYALTNVVTHEDGMEYTARAIQAYVPDHEADVEHPEGPTEDPPQEFADWPIWPLEIYQDELDDQAAGDFEAELEEALDDLGGDTDDLATIRDLAEMEDPLIQPLDQ